jgi:hypothetical protein
LLGALLLTPPATAQSAAATPPEPIYWRQNLLTVPYQWRSTAGGTTAKSVRLYASQDRGASWQPVSDAQPQLLAFNYRAAADGEFWFAIRTTDASGRDAPTPTAPGPNGAMQPELRVIVDTTMPRIESLSGQQREDGTLEIHWRVADANLGAHSCNVEVQADASASWQPVPLTSASEVSLGTWEGLATFAASAESRPMTVRATAIDLAGNRAVYQSAITTATPANPLGGGGPAISSGRSDPALAPIFAADPGWVSSSAPSTIANVPSGPAEPQLWPADRTANAAIPSSAERTSSIAYGTPLEADDSAIAVAEERVELPEPKTDDRPLGNVPPLREPAIEPVQPFRQVSMSHARVPSNELPPSIGNDVPPPPANPLAKLVNSRSFALEYELAEVGEAGVAKVELWGTSDSGQTWRNYAVDDDNRSPLDVTVDGEGEYGFSIVVVAAGSLGGFPPQPGDTPDLWVDVDLQPPLVQILSVNTTRGDAGGELTVRWQADDDNLEPRPIALFYSSRPAGPWTTIATSLENAGEYRWPLERHVPRRVYLKLEARDIAGNVAAFQTSEPVVVESETVESEPAVASWQRLPPVE